MTQPNDRYDSETIMGCTAGMDVGLKTLIHDLYSRDMSIKIKQGRLAKALKGEHLCKIAPYGYMKSKTVRNKLIIDEEAATVVKRIFNMACEGHTLTNIAKTLNCDKVLTPLMYRKRNNTDKGRGWRIAGDENYWTPASVKRIVTDERFTGKMISGKLVKPSVGEKKMCKTPRSQWVIVPDAHEAVISQREFDKAQLILKPRLTPVKGGERSLFAGKIICGHCGHTFMFQTAQRPYYACVTSRFVPDAKCKSNRVFEDELKTLAAASFNNNILLAVDPKKRLKDIKKDSAAAITALNQKAKGIRAKIERNKALRTSMFERYNDGMISKELFLSKKEICSTEIDRLNTELSSVNNDILNRRRLADNDGSYDTFEPYNIMSFVNRETLFLDRIIVYNASRIELSIKA